MAVMHNHFAFGADIVEPENLPKAPDWVYEQIKTECISWAKQFRSTPEFERIYVLNCVNLSLDNEGFRGVKYVNWQPKNKRK